MPCYTTSPPRHVSVRAAPHDSTSRHSRWRLAWRVALTDLRKDSRSSLVARFPKENTSSVSTCIATAGATRIGSLLPSS